MQSWIASALGFALNHIEEAFGQLFGLKGQPDEYLEFDTQALLRSAFKERIEALARASSGGISSPERGARRARACQKCERFGDEPRVQQQVVPLSAAGASRRRPAGRSAAGARTGTGRAVRGRGRGRGSQVLEFHDDVARIR